MKLKSKLISFVVLCVFSFQVAAVEYIPYAPGGAETDKWINVLRNAAKKAAEELAQLKTKSPRMTDEDFVTNYVDRIAGKGTISSWKLYRINPDGSWTEIDNWHSRNGKSIKENLSLKTDRNTEQFAHQGGAERESTRMPVGQESQRFSDAEIKSLERAMRIRQKNGLRPSQVALEGVVDKPACSSCALNLADAELPTGTAFDSPLNALDSQKVAGRIRIRHLNKDAAAQFRETRIGAVNSELTRLGCL
ncbi:hypothetical protein [Lysobacter sp. CA196]|uniref:hypothetical protein n=1 Tax=Lysobacter sp. CA196 TaxID=3455606 RepID=UPI003F8D5359